MARWPLCWCFASCVESGSASIYPSSLRPPVLPSAAQCWPPFDSCEDFECLFFPLHIKARSHSSISSPLHDLIIHCLFDVERVCYRWQGQVARIFPSSHLLFDVLQSQVLEASIIIVELDEKPVVRVCLQIRMVVPYAQGQQSIS